MIVGAIHQKTANAGDAHPSEGYLLLMFHQLPSRLRLAATSPASSWRCKEANSEGKQHEAAEGIDGDVYGTGHMEITQLITGCDFSRGHPSRFWFQTSFVGFRAARRLPRRICRRPTGCRCAHLPRPRWQALKRFSQTPLTAQREKRLCVLHQPPKRSGKSRHGVPTRNFQITASTKRRLPRSLLRPTVPGRPGSKCSIRAN